MSHLPDDPDILAARQASAAEFSPVIAQRQAAFERYHVALQAYQQAIANGDDATARQQRDAMADALAETDHLQAVVAAGFVEMVRIAARFDPGTLSQILGPIVDRRIVEASAPRT